MWKPTLSYHPWEVNECGQVRRKITSKLKGNKNGLGHIVSEESRKKMSKAAKLREARKREEREFNERY